MAIRYRRMRAEDVQECVAILATDPLIASRYGSLIEQLGRVFQRLLHVEAFRAVVFEDDGPRLVGAGISAFVSEDYVKTIKGPPLFWVAPDLALRILAGRSPLLSDQQLQVANTTTGLTNFTWHGCMRDPDRTRPEVQNCVIKAFVEEHRGYFMREIIAQADTMPMIKNILSSNGRAWNPSRHDYELEPAESAEVLLTRPHLFGFTREHAAALPVNWISAIFMSESPRFGFSLGEQRLLVAALGGGIDGELSDALGVTLSAVKKTWRAIYHRVSTIVPDLVAEDSGSGVRGREKRPRLIAYLRDHPEELRPISRRFLAQRRPR